MEKKLPLSASTLLLLLPDAALAFTSTTRTFTVLGSSMTLPDFLQGIVTAGAQWIAALCTTLFLVGAFWKVINANKEERAKQGTTIMTNAVVGLGIVLLSYAIIRTVFYIIF